MNILNKLKILMFLVLVFQSCEFKNRKSELEQVELQQKIEDSIFKNELKLAEIPYPELGIDKSLLNKYLNESVYRKFIINDRKHYKHESNKKTYRIKAIEDYYECRVYSISWDSYERKQFLKKDEAIKFVENEILKSKISLNTNIYAIWKLKQ